MNFTAAADNDTVATADKVHDGDDNNDYDKVV